MRLALVALLSVLAFPAWGQKSGTPGQFDHYVLALSWSPTYCAGRAGRQDAEQCGGAKSYGFVVHGLWPQYAQTGYPVECAAQPQAVPDDVAAAALAFMPSRKLVDHQWKRHGTCDGSTPAQYFAKTRDAFAAIKVPAEFVAPKGPLTLSPEQVEALFAAANPGLSPQRMAVVCRGHHAAELRVCLTKEMAFTDCAKSVRDRCAGQALFPPVR